MGHGRDIEPRLSDTRRGHYGTIWGMDGMVSGGGPVHQTTQPPHRVAPARSAIVFPCILSRRPRRQPSPYLAVLLTAAHLLLSLGVPSNRVSTPPTRPPIQIGG